MVEFIPWCKPRQVYFYSSEPTVTDCLALKVKYVPEWFPGAGFKKVAREANVLSRRVWQEPHEEAKRKFVCGKPRRTIVANFALQFDGTARPSLTSNMIEQNLQPDGQITDEDIISQVAGTAYAAGADTVCRLPTFATNHILIILL